MDVGSAALPSIEHLGLLVPGTTATRWLLVADLVCLLAIGFAARRPSIALPLVLGSGFLALNILAMLTMDFFLGLALFHLAVGLVTLITLRLVRWLGAAALALSLMLGVLT